MKSNRYLLGTALLAWSSTFAAPAPLGTAFTYQGRLADGGGPANGNYDFGFKLYDDPLSGTEISSASVVYAQPVSNGQFTVMLDFGSGAMSGEARWLEIWVRTNAPSAAFASLAPRQPITPAPYALYAPTAGAALLASNVAAAGVNAPQLGTPTAPAAGQVLSFNGSSLLWTTPPTPPTLPPPAWSLAGNADTIPGVNFLGTTDNQPLQLQVNGAAGLVLQPTPAGGVNILGGQGASIAAGVNYATIGGGYANTLAATTDNSTISGGNQNWMDANAQFNVIGGGYGNSLSSYTWWSGIGSGRANNVGASAPYNYIGGGQGNRLGDGDRYSVVSGGASNQVTVGVWYSIIGGGTLNAASADCATIAGGSNNLASGVFSTIGGGALNVATNLGDTVSGGYSNWATGGYSTVAGGELNRADGLTSTVGGGYENWALEWDSTVSGGAANWAYGISSTIGGGTYNETLNMWGAVGGGKANYAGYISTIAGGLQNNADNVGSIGGGYGNIANGWCAAVPGGYTNRAAGAYSFAAGRRAKAMADGAFVWADTTDADFVSNVTNQFAVRATGGVLINADTNNLELASGGIKVTGAGVGTSTPVFVHKATTATIAASAAAFATVISNPYTDGAPGALLFITHNWSQDNISETHPIGVYYNNGHWIIYHEDGAAMPVGMAYNVLVFRP